MNKTVALTLFATLLIAPAFAQDAPPATTMGQSADEQAQMKAEDERQQHTTPMTSNDAADAMQTTPPTTPPTAAPMTSNDAAAAAATSHQVDFAALDKNSDGSLSQGEVNASGDADLIRDFGAIDSNHNGRLSKDELKGWSH
ncbi:hypothetical protein J2X04_002036 [Lysobacter niabensis]|uniref:EF-hand domain-containing protein n=1 Tax=Agrilutibacter niabensis TaxID=380628 RepID=A0ABU1VQ96_9GAMM|nr:EF-hand domain-containing protein [Lysobacter niabensis]MDR7099655.1 hypothetical protein [Lysobacter niabensis]